MQSSFEVVHVWNPCWQIACSVMIFCFKIFLLLLPLLICWWIAQLLFWLNCKTDLDSPRSRQVCLVIKVGSLHIIDLLTLQHHEPYLPYQQNYPDCAVQDYCGNCTIKTIKIIHLCIIMLQTMSSQIWWVVSVAAYLV